MENVFLLDGGDFRIVEALDTKSKFGFTHNEGVIIDGFSCVEDAKEYCAEFNYKIINL